MGEDAVIAEILSNLVWASGAVGLATLMFAGARMGVQKYLGKDVTITIDLLVVLVALIIAGSAAMIANWIT